MPSGHAFTSNQSGVERLFFRARLPAMGKAAAVGAAARSAHSQKLHEKLGDGGTMEIIEIGNEAS